MSLTARGLTVRVGGNVALDDVSFEIPKGTTAAPATSRSCQEASTTTTRSATAAGA